MLGHGGSAQYIPNAGTLAGPTFGVLSNEAPSTSVLGGELGRLDALLSEFTGLNNRLTSALDNTLGLDAPPNANKTAAGNSNARLAALSTVVTLVAEQIDRLRVQVDRAERV